MSALPITLFFSLLLALLFVTLFALEQRRRNHTCAERDSLLPLADETAHVVVPADPIVSASAAGERPIADMETGDHHESEPAAEEHEHDHSRLHPHSHSHLHSPSSSHDLCGCRTGLRPPCPGCLKQHLRPVSPA